MVVAMGLLHSGIDEAATVVFATLHPGCTPFAFARGRRTIAREEMSDRERNPWVAVEVATDPVAHATALKRAHERGLAGGSPEMRSLIAASWRRSLAAGVDPESPPEVLLDEQALVAARERSPLAPAIEAVHAALSDLDAETRGLVAIADADATLLWVDGDDSVCELARRMRFEEGASWAESAAGTNAVGTAAALDHAVQIFSAEHLVTAVHPWTCAAAPIHDPDTGELLGIVDLTAAMRTAHPHTLSLATLAAHAAEATLRLRSLELGARLRERWERALVGRRCPSLVVDESGKLIAARGAADLPPRVELPAGRAGAVTLPDGRVCEAEPLDGGAILWLARRRRSGAPRLRLRLLGHGAHAVLAGGPAERALRSLELLAVLALHPEGLTAEQLALALYGEEGKTVTVRAQVHRVRAHLGEALVTAQPYRLPANVDADWLTVQRLVAEGKPREALAAYSGPLLPTSEAPAIAEARGLLEESLRRSVLTTADPDLLARWLAHPAGASDLAASRALVAVLPPGDPRRAAATATAAHLARLATA
jgi:GAF domain